MVMISRRLLVISFLLALLVLSACAPSVTQAPQADAEAAATMAAATVNAALTAAAPSATLAPTLEPTATETIAPSATPEPTVTPEPSATLAPTATPVPQLRVAYVQQGNVFWHIDGLGSVGLTNSGDALNVRISPDGQLVAYTRRGADGYSAGSLWVASTVGYSNPRQLVSPDELWALKPDDEWVVGVSIYQFEWRPGTHELAYSTYPRYDGPGFSPNNDLRLVNADTLGKTTLFGIGEGGMFYYSPDGSQIALVRPDSISLVNADGSDMRQNVLTFPTVGTYSEYQYYPHPRWAANSGMLRVAIPPAETLADPLPSTGLWQLPTNGSAAYQIGAIRAIPFAWPDTAYSPDLQRVGYAVNVGEPAANQRELRLADATGDNRVVFITGELLEFGAWAPDSLHFDYLSNAGVFIAEVGGSPVQISPDRSKVRDLRWVSGERYLYLLGFGNDAWLLYIAVVGGAARPIDSASAYDFIP